MEDLSLDVIFHMKFLSTSGNMPLVMNCAALVFAKIDEACCSAGEPVDVFPGLLAQVSDED